jgi:hypothetical protein
MTPIVLSLIIGLLYMESRLRIVDDMNTRVAVIQIAWTISSYPVGAAGGERFFLL